MAVRRLQLPADVPLLLKPQLPGSVKITSGVGSRPSTILDSTSRSSSRGLPARLNDLCEVMQCVL